jgi:D-amino-acid dehydrogenase
MPVLGAIPERPGAFVATGHGASGLTFGPWSASAVVEHALGTDAAPDLSPFAPPVPAAR